MANAVYPKFREAQIDAAANIDLNAGTLKAYLIDLADYTYSAAHVFLSEIPAGGIVATSAALANVTITNGLLDADNAVFTSVTGDPCEAVILAIDTGTAATSRLVAFFDTGVTGLPVTPNGTNINLNFNASGIVQF